MATSSVCLTRFDTAIAAVEQLSCQIKDNTYTMMLAVSRSWNDAERASEINIVVTDVD